MLCHRLRQYSQYSFFDGILKTALPHIIYRDRVLICSHIIGKKSTIIADQFMKITGQVVMVELIKGYWKNEISGAQFSSS